MRVDPGKHSHAGLEGRVIERVYDAACDASEWPTALDTLASSFQSLCATYFVWRRKENTLGFFQHSSQYGGHDLYRAHYSTLDPRRKLSQQMPESGIFRCHEHLDESYIQDSEFYQDFSLPHERRYLMSTHLIKTENLSLYAVLHRAPNQGHFTKDDAVQLEQLAPHLRRAAKIQAKLEEVDAARRASEAALDQLIFGLITVDQNGRVLSMNRMAEDVIADQDGLWVHRGSLMTRLPHEVALLQRCIREATEPTTQANPRQGASLLITRPSGRGAYRLLVAPLSDGAAARFDPKLGRTAIVMVRDPEKTVLPPEQHLVGLFGLTHAEAQIALALLAGKRLEDVAEERAVSLGTVRSQFKAILRKTEVDRQAELVRALLTIPTIRQIT
jgi:DNA-binding CsgD family transcriptional regulator